MGRNNSQIENILREATYVLNTAMKHSTTLSKSGITSEKLLQMRMLITKITLHSYTNSKNNSQLPKEIQELQDVKDLILKKAEEKFGNKSKTFSEFRFTAYTRTK